MDGCHRIAERLAAEAQACLSPSGWPRGQGDVAERLAAEALIVDVDGYEGPLDLLLTLARTQKVDLRQISSSRWPSSTSPSSRRRSALRIELAADYLVMAAWLAFLKSRLLLPPDPAEEGPSGDDLAAHLAFQLNGWRRCATPPPS